MFVYETIRTTMNKHLKPTESELEILNIIWQNGPSTVREVHDILSRTKESGYTTTLKLMQIMNDKGILHRNTETKTHVYSAAIKQEQVQGQLLKRMVDTIFNGSTAAMVMQALGNTQADTKELEQIKNYLKEMEQKTK